MWRYLTTVQSRLGPDHEWNGLVAGTLCFVESGGEREGRKGGATKKIIMVAGRENGVGTQV